MFTVPKTIAVVGIALAAAGMSATNAFAQGLLPVEKPFRIKIGEYVPNSGDVKDAVGDDFLSIGASFDFNKTTATNPVIYNVYADYADKSRTDFGFKNELGIFGLGVAARFTLAPATAVTGHPYGEIGLGYYSITAKNSFQSDGDTFTSSVTKGRFGGKLAGGYELPVGLFAELEYDLITKVNSYDPSGYRINLGYRF